MKGYCNAQSNSAATPGANRSSYPIIAPLDRPRGAIRALQHHAFPLLTLHPPPGAGQPSTGAGPRSHRKPRRVDERGRQRHERRLVPPCPELDDAVTGTEILNPPICSITAQTQTQPPYTQGEIESGRPFCRGSKKEKGKLTVC